MNERIAIVTGGNRGIGLEVCRQLAARPDLQVLLTARRKVEGETAVAELHRLGHDVRFWQLDVTDAISVRRLVRFVADEWGRADVLVNNAGVFLDRHEAPPTVAPALVRQTMEVNLYGALSLIQALLPLMERHDYGRVVNVSSRMGSLAEMGSGGNALAYRTSKTALNAMTRVLAGAVMGRNILINAASPGWVRTDMGGEHAARTVAEGADTIVWLATLPDDGPTGGFFHDRQPSPW